MRRRDHPGRERPVNADGACGGRHRGASYDGPTMTTSTEPDGRSGLPPFDQDTPVSEPDDPIFASRTLRSFVRAGRLVRIPARERKRRVILRWLIDEVLPDEAPVQERELNMRIALRHPDAASLRRFLVDSRLAERHGMVYRRVIPVGEVVAVES
jgi:hypothetical protein